MSASPREYLDWLEKNARQRQDAWWLLSERTGTDESRRKKLLATLRFFNKDDKLADLDARLRREPLRSDLSPDLRGVVEQTAQDLHEYVLPSETDEFQRTVFGLLPLSAVDAFCVDRTLWGRQLDGYLVILNEGLFVCAQLLAKAFLLENLAGDLSEFRRSGAPTRRAAAEHFLAPSSKHANAVFFEGVPPDIEGMLSGAQMNMTILLLQFIMLHEVGHIINRDFGLMGEYRFHMAQAADVPPSMTDKWWAAEHAADEYALSAICRHSQSDIGRWANFISVYVFFDWLHSVEVATGRPLCPLHPPPTARGERLLQLMHTRFPPDEVVEAHLRESLDILSSWRQADGAS